MLRGNEDTIPTYLGRMQDIQLNLLELQQTLTQINESALSLKPSEMTLLQRSMASGRIPSLLKDPTQPVAGFLLAAIEGIGNFFEALGYSQLQNQTFVQIIHDILKFSWDMVRLTQCKTLDVGIFQTYLQIGQRIVSVAGGGYSPLETLKTTWSRSLETFGESWNLTTGLSLQRLWDLWRPATPTDLEHLQSMIELETIASRFDRIIFKARVPLSQLSQVRNSLLEAQSSMLVNSVNGQLLVKVSYRDKHVYKEWTLMCFHRTFLKLSKISKVFCRMTDQPITLISPISSKRFANIMTWIQSGVPSRKILIPYAAFYICWQLALPSQLTPRILIILFPVYLASFPDFLGLKERLARHLPCKGQSLCPY